MTSPSLFKIILRLYLIFSLTCSTLSFPDWLSLSHINMLWMMAGRTQAHLLCPWHRAINWLLFKLDLMKKKHTHTHLRGNNWEGSEANKILDIEKKKEKHEQEINPSNLSLVPICFGRGWGALMPEQANSKHKKALSLLTAQIKHDPVASCSDTAMPLLAMRIEWVSVCLSVCLCLWRS